MVQDKKILVCYNEPAKLYANYLGKAVNSKEENTDLSETDVASHINVTLEGLRRYYPVAEAIPFGSDIEETIRKIREFNPDVIFNLVESVDGYSDYEAYAAGVFELMGIQYTGNLPLSLGNCLNKSRTKLILRSFGISTPPFQIARCQSGLQEFETELKFPVILKLLNEDASIGISEFSVAHSPSEVIKRLKFLFKTYRQDVLIEEYIEGRELNVAVLGHSALPVSEIDFTGLPESLPKIVTYEGKWSPESLYYKHTNPRCPAVLSEELKTTVEETALKAFDALGCRDYARVDIRLDASGRPYVIEVNPNPDISTDSGFARAAAAAGMSYPELLYSISLLAINRKINDTEIKV